jgi:hypothetical protein
MPTGVCPQTAGLRPLEDVVRGRTTWEETPGTSARSLRAAHAGADVPFVGAADESVRPGFQPSAEVRVVRNEEGTV